MSVDLNLKFNKCPEILKKRLKVQHIGKFIYEVKEGLNFREMSKNNFRTRNF